jgi:hypothetical protein
LAHIPNRMMMVMGRIHLKPSPDAASFQFCYMQHRTRSAWLMDISGSIQPGACWQSCRCGLLAALCVESWLFLCFATERCRSPVGAHPTLLDGCILLHGSL